MTAKLILFSPTGGTEKCARLLGSALADDLEVLDLTDPAFSPRSLSGEDPVAILALPSYGGRVPALAARRLQKIRGNGTPMVLLCVYGNRAYDDTLAEMEDLAKQQGFRVMAAVAAVAEHSIMHQYATGRPDATDEASLRGMGKNIRRKLEAGNLDTPSIPGKRPYQKAGSVPLVPRATGACVGCGLCARQCPAGAISPDSLKHADGKKCIACMRCVVRCPQGARKVNGAMVSAAALTIRRACSIRKECEAYF